jgi:hypothetical protein
MRCTPRARLALILLLACAPTARADGPLGPGAPCKTAQQVVDAMAFKAGFDVDRKSCEKLCKKAGATCAKHVNRAITCGRNSSDDSTFFQVKVSCDGEKGAALKACAAPFEAAKKADRAALLSERDARLADCTSKAQACATGCSDAP